MSNGADSEDDESELEGFSDSEFEADNEDEEGIWKDVNANYLSNLNGTNGVNS